MIRSFVLFAFVALALSGCGKTEKEKTQEKVDQGNEMISRINDINKNVGKKYSVLLINRYDNVSGLYNVKSINASSISKLSETEIADLQVLTSEFRELCERVIRIIDSKNVTGGERDTLVRSESNARSVQKLIEEEIEKRKQNPEQEAA